MYKSYKVTLSTTTPKLLFGTPAYATSNIPSIGDTNDPVPVMIVNTSTHTIHIGSDATATCVFPVASKSSIPFGVIGESALYGYSPTGAASVYVLIGR